VLLNLRCVPTAPMPCAVTSREPAGGCWAGGGGIIVELTAARPSRRFMTELSSQAELLEVARSGALGMGRNVRALRVVPGRSS